VAAARCATARSQRSRCSSTACRCPRSPRPSKARRFAQGRRPFQPVERDFAFLIDAAAVPAEKMPRARATSIARSSAAVARVRRLRRQGRTGGQEIGRDRRHPAAHREATLTDAEIEAIGAKVVAAVQKQTGGALRN
jgi:phenylalanyl-tRNA synthetase beta chain